VKSAKDQAATTSRNVPIVMAHSIASVNGSPWSSQVNHLKTACPIVGLPTAADRPRSGSPRSSPKTWRRRWRSWTSRRSRSPSRRSPNRAPGSTPAASVDFFGLAADQLPQRVHQAHSPPAASSAATPVPTPGAARRVHRLPPTALILQSRSPSRRFEPFRPVTWVVGKSGRRGDRHLDGAGQPGPFSHGSAVPRPGGSPVHRGRARRRSPRCSCKSKTLPRSSSVTTMG
jgi:hypothetical protein